MSQRILLCRNGWFKVSCYCGLLDSRLAILVVTKIAWVMLSISGLLNETLLDSVRFDLTHLLLLRFEDQHSYSVQNGCKFYKSYKVNWILSSIPSNFQLKAKENECKTTLKCKNVASINNEMLIFLHHYNVLLFTYYTHDNFHIIHPLLLQLLLPSSLPCLLLGRERKSLLSWLFNFFFILLPFLFSHISKTVCRLYVAHVKPSRWILKFASVILFISKKAAAKIFFCVIPLLTSVHIDLSSSTRNQ